MDVFEAVDSRIACRAFLDKPVDLEHRQGPDHARGARGLGRQSAILEHLCADRQAARRVQGDRARAHRQRRPAPHQDGISGLSRSDVRRLQGPPRGAWRPALRLARHRPQRPGRPRLAQFNKNFEFFDAPVALFITIDRRLGPGQWADLGGYIHALAFLARGYGLDTCPQEAWARLYDTVGDFLKLPANEMLFCGMAIGYGDRKHKANDFRSPRAELNEFCKFYGFD